MLDLETIASYYNTQQKIFKKNILREYLQYKILNIIFSSSIGRKFSFIGGTSIRIVYNINRFSEDLDFDNFGIKKEEFVSLSNKIKNELELEGYKLELKIVLKGAFRSYFRFLNLLFNEGLSPHKQEKLMIQVDTEPQNFYYQYQTYLLSKFDVFTNIFITPVDILLSLKLFAFLNRKKIKARDIYDIIFLSGKTSPNYQFLNDKMEISNKDILKKQLIQRCDYLNLKKMRKEIEPFLIKKNDSKKLELFKEYIFSL